MAGECLHPQVIALGPPQFNRFVLTARRQELPVGGKGDRRDGIRVMTEGIEEIAILGTPEPHARIPTHTGQDSAIWTKRQIAHPICMPR